MMIVNVGDGSRLWHAVCLRICSRGCIPRPPPVWNCAHPARL